MRIRASAWHLQVFLQAYVRDRYWLDAGIINPATERPELPETAAYRAFREKCDAMPSERRFNEETQKELHELGEAWREACVRWHETQEAVYTADRSREVSERLHGGRMSLCPYFWSVIAALVCYYGFVRSTRPLRQLIHRAVLSLAATFLVLGIGLSVALSGYVIYAERDRIPTPAGIVAGIKTEYRAYRQLQQQETEYEAKRLQEQQEWERANPQEAALRRQQEEYSRQQQERWRAEGRAEERAADWKELKGFAASAAAFVGMLVGVVLAIALLYSAARLLGKACSFLKRLLRPAVALLSFKSVPETGFRAWLVRQFRRVTSAWAVWLQFWKDTRELFIAFAKAKKQRVCPYLTIVNGEHGA